MFFWSASNADSPPLSTKNNIECLFRGGVVQKEVKISLFLSRWQKHPIPFIDHRESPFTFRRRNTKRDPFRATSKSGAKPTGLSLSFSARAIGDAARDRGRSDVGNGLCTIIIIIIIIVGAHGILIELYRITKEFDESRCIFHVVCTPSVIKPRRFAWCATKSSREKKKERASMSRAHLIRGADDRVGRGRDGKHVLVGVCY